MFRNPQQGVLDNLHWFAGQDLEDPSLLHITLHDENGQNTYYNFRFLDSQRFDMSEVIKEYREWLNSRRLPEQTHEQSTKIT